MTIAIIITILVLAGIFYIQARELAPADFTFLGAAVFFALTGIINSNELVAGFSNPGLVTVAMLFVVAQGMQETGLIHSAGEFFFGKAKSVNSVFWRMAAILIPSSAFLNNTPVVAMVAPIISDWCKRHDVAPSKLLMSVSYLAILGGTCTLIGTSTNIVVNSLLMNLDAYMPLGSFDSLVGDKLREFHFFEISLIGVPYAVVGVLFLALVRRYMPERLSPMQEAGGSDRKFLVEMKVEKNCPLIGKSIVDGGLRQLKGLFLVAIYRANRLYSAVPPEEVIHEGDHLICTGVVDTVLELKHIPHLIPVADPNYKISPRDQSQLRLWEVVISDSSPLVGRTIKEADFRSRYNAAVLAVHRHGVHLYRKVGDITMRPGDTLILQAGENFRKTFRNHTDFYLVSNVAEWRPFRRDKAKIAFTLLLVLIVLMTSGLVSNVVAASVVALGFMASRCIRVSAARTAIDWNVIVTIGAAFAVGMAVKNSGLATLLADGLVWISQGAGPVLVLLLCYLTVSLVTEFITNNAAAILFFPVFIEIAEKMAVDPRPFVVVLMLTASASFATPFGYQTNLMVFGPGGYKLKDFFIFGAPLNILLGIVAALLVPLIWPF